MNKNQEQDAWDAERAYKRLKKAIIEMQAKENPTDCFAICTQYQLRVSLCANGQFPIELFKQALQQLHTHDEIAYGNRYVSYPADRHMATDAIEWVSEQEEVDKAFIGRMNKLIQGGELED